MADFLTFNGIGKSSYRIQRFDYPINNQADVFSDVIYSECIKKRSEDKHSSAILFGRIAADVDHMHGLYQPLEMKTQLTRSLARLTARGRSYCLGPDLETLKMVKECDPIGAGVVADKATKQLKQCCPPYSFHLLDGSPCKYFAGLNASSIIF